MDIPGKACLITAELTGAFTRWSQQRSTRNNFNSDDLFLLVSLKESSLLIIYRRERRAVRESQVKYQSMKEILNIRKESFRHFSSD